MLKGSAASDAAAGAAGAAERCVSANAPVSASATQMAAAAKLLFRERAGCTCWIGVSSSPRRSERSPHWHWGCPSRARARALRSREMRQARTHQTIKPCTMPRIIQLFCFRVYLAIFGCIWPAPGQAVFWVYLRVYLDISKPCPGLGAQLHLLGPAGDAAPLPRY